MGRWLTNFVLIVVLIGAAAYLNGRIGASQTAMCNSLRKQNHYILKATDRAEKTLPTISYYKTHPKELEAVRQQLRDQRADFSNDPCTNG